MASKRYDIEHEKKKHRTHRPKISINQKDYRQPLIVFSIDIQSDIFLFIQDK